MSQNPAIENSALLQDPSDQELLDRVRTKDLNAYAELMRRYQGKIYGLIYHMTANKEDAEDIVQDVFVKAYASLDSFRGGSSFYTWIYRIAVNTTLNHLKKTGRRRLISLDDTQAGVERDPAFLECSARRRTPVQDVAIGELQEKLNKALLSLSEKHRIVAVLHDLQGVPHEEIANMLGCSPGTVRSRLFYARQTLQGELAEFLP